MFVSDDMRERLVGLIRDSLTENQKTAILILAEDVMTQIITEEVADAMSGKFELVYESVIAQVIQQQLLAALEKRGEQHLASIAGGKSA